MSRVIVTGGSGFVGSAVTQGLMALGDDVAVLDIAKPQFDANWLKADLLESADLRHLLDGYDAVCHLAGVGDVYEADRNPTKAAELNVRAASKTAIESAAAGVRSFLFASTWEVYGTPVYQPADERHPCSPRHPYSISKLKGEKASRSICQRHRVRFVSLRLGTGYGPGMRDTTVMMKFMKSGMEGNPIRVHGSGGQFRQFTHVQDIAAAFGKALEYHGEHDTFNIVAEEKTTIIQLAHLIGDVFEVPIEFEGARAGEPPSLAVSSELARTELSWSAQLVFRSALLELIANMRAG